MPTEAQRAAKRRYKASVKGKAAKVREQAQRRAVFAADAGLRAQRAADAKEWRRLYPEYTCAAKAIARVGLPVTDFERWVLREAVLLAKLRTKLFGRVWEVDHIEPVSRGGTNAVSNIQVVPQAWNRAKFNRHAERFLGA